MSMTPGELRPAFRDPTATEALRREYRERARLPVSRRAPMPPELVETEYGAVFVPPATYEDGIGQLAALRGHVKRVMEAIIVEKASDRPDKRELTRLGGEQARLQSRVKELSDWLRTQRPDQATQIGLVGTAGAQKRTPPNPENTARLMAAIEDGGASIMVRLYGALQARIRAGDTITADERAAMGDASYYLRKQHGIRVGDLFPASDATDAPPA